MIAYEMACQLHKKCPPFAHLSIFMQENWTQSVHNIQFLFLWSELWQSKKNLERSSLPSKNFPCISMDMLQIGALLLLGRLVEANRIEEACETHSDTEGGKWCIAWLKTYKYVKYAFFGGWSLYNTPMQGIQ